MTTFLFFQQIFLVTCCVLVIVLDAMYTAVGKKNRSFSLPSRSLCSCSGRQKIMKYIRVSSGEKCNGKKLSQTRVHGY